MGSAHIGPAVGFRHDDVRSDPTLDAAQLVQIQIRHQVADLGPDVLAALIHRVDEGANPVVLEQPCGARPRVRVEHRIAILESVGDVVVRRVEQSAHCEVRFSVGRGWQMTSHSEGRR